MPRRSQYKKKRHSADKTILVFGEGLNEEIFLKYLRSLYSRGVNVAITIRRGRGGTADGLVIQAHRTPGAYDMRVAVLDNDKKASEMQQSRKEAEDRDIKLLEHTPCLEAVLLSILCKGKDFKDKTSSWCKSEFESKYIEKKKRSEIREYLKLFPKKLLEEQCVKVAELEKLISLMKGALE